MTNPLNNLSHNDRKSINQAKKNNKKEAITEPVYDYPEISNTASADGLTGLMHVPPQNEDELEAYQDLSGMPAPKKDGKGSYKNI